MNDHDIKRLHPPEQGNRVRIFSPGLLVEQPSAMLFTAGQTPSDINGDIVGEGDFIAQARQVFENLGSVLRAGNMDFTNVLKFTTYLVNPEHLPLLREVRAELYPQLFGELAPPADTLLIVARLARPEFLVEIEAVAAKPPATG